MYQDLRDKYGNSPVVLNGLAVCALQQHNYPEAETCLLDALEKVLEAIYCVCVCVCVFSNVCVNR